MNTQNIPVVGQPGVIMLWYPTAMIHCTCVSEGMSIVVLTGFGTKVPCPHCHTHYWLMGLGTDGKGNAVVAVDYEPKGMS